MKAGKRKGSLSLTLLHPPPFSPSSLYSLPPFDACYRATKITFFSWHFTSTIKHSLPICRVSMMARLRSTSTYLPFKFYPILFDKDKQNFIAYKFVSGTKTVSRRTLQVDAIAGTQNDIHSRKKTWLSCSKAG